MVRIGICDDEPVHLEQLASLLHHCTKAMALSSTIASFDRVSDLLYAAREKRFDLLFLDILLREENGIDIARQFLDEGHDADIVFVSSSEQFALRSFHVQPLHYLLKPLEMESVKEALERFDIKRRDMAQSLAVADVDGALHFLAPGKIESIEVIRKHSIIKLDSGQQVVVEESLSMLCKRLPPKHFYLSHRSYLVNLRHVSAIVKYAFKLQSGDTVPIAQSRYSEAMNRIVGYFDVL